MSGKPLSAPGDAKTPEVWTVQEYYSGIENTKTRFNRSYLVDFTLADGSVRQVLLPAGTSWGDQMNNQWEPAIAAAFPEACEVKNHWWEWRPANLPNTGAGAIPPADMSFPNAFGQFIQITFCPEDAALMVVQADILEINGAEAKPQQLITATDVGKAEYVTRCNSCDEKDAEEPPKCGVPPGATLPEVPAPNCSVERVDLCIRTDDADVPAVGFLTTCDGEIQPIEIFVVDEDGNLEEPPEGEVLLANKEPFVQPVSCPFPEAFKEICPDGIPGADNTTGFQYINGRPNAAAPWQLIDNLDGQNNTVVIEGANLGEFIANMEAAGYTEWSFGEQHFFCPCPPGWTEPGSFTIAVDGNTAVKIDCQPLTELPGAPDKIVEDKAYLRTFEKNSAAILAEMQTQTKKLCEIRDLLDCSCVDLIVGKPTLTDEEGGDSGIIVDFPLLAPPGELRDFITPLALPADPCLTALDPTTKIRVRMCWSCHDLVSADNGTTGAQVIVGPIDGSGPAMNAGWSTTNTSPQNMLGGSNGFMGTSSGALDKADRWIDFDVPVGDLLAGTTITTSAFGSSNATVTEYLGGQQIKLLTDLSQFDCEVC